MYKAVLKLHFEIKSHCSLEKTNWVPSRLMCNNATTPKREWDLRLYILYCLVP